MPEVVTIADEGWRADELAALVAAARGVFRSAEIAGRLRGKADPLRVTVDGALLWRLGEAIDGPYERLEAEDPALGDDGAAAA